MPNDGVHDMIYPIQGTAMSGVLLSGSNLVTLTSTGGATYYNAANIVNAQNE